jgi:hypothetical protein
MVRACDVEGVVACVAAVDAFDRAVTGTMFGVSVSPAALGGVFRVRVGCSAEVAADSITFQLAHGITGCMSKAVAAGALAEGRARFEAASQSPSSENTDG